MVTHKIVVNILVVSSLQVVVIVEPGISLSLLDEYVHKIRAEGREEMKDTTVCGQTNENILFKNQAF